MRDEYPGEDSREQHAWQDTLSPIPRGLWSTPELAGNTRSGYFEELAGRLRLLTGIKGSLKGTQGS